MEKAENRNRRSMVPYEKPIEWRADGPNWLRNPLWCSWKYVQRVGDPYPALVLPSWIIWGSDRLQVRAIRYEGSFWHWWVDEDHASGVYDDGTPFTCGGIRWLDYQIEWSFKRAKPPQSLPLEGKQP